MWSQHSKGEGDTNAHSLIKHCVQNTAMKNRHWSQYIPVLGTCMTAQEKERCTREALNLFVVETSQKKRKVMNKPNLQ